MHLRDECEFWFTAYSPNAISASDKERGEKREGGGKRTKVYHRFAPYAVTNGERSIDIRAPLFTGAWLKSAPLHDYSATALEFLSSVSSESFYSLGKFGKNLTSAIQSFPDGLSTSLYFKIIKQYYYYKQRRQSRENCEINPRNTSLANTALSGDPRSQVNALPNKSGDKVNYTSASGNFSHISRSRYNVWNEIMYMPEIFITSLRERARARASIVVKSYIR